MFEKDYRGAMEKSGMSGAQMGRLLAAIREEKRPRRGMQPLRVAAAVALAAALCAGGALALPELLTMVGDAVDYFQIPAQFRQLSREVEPQPFSAALGASVEDGGYTLTVEGVAIDDAFVTLYYTVTGEEPIPVQGERPTLWSLRLKADGEYLEFWDRELAVELEDEYTLHAIQRCPVLAALPDVVELEIYSGELFGGGSGTWSLSLRVDKSAPAAESLVAAPGQSVTMDGRRVTVDKVVVAPSGSGLVLTGAGEAPPTQFILRDDRGEALSMKWWGQVSRPVLPVSNFIEFFGGRTDMASITLVPWESSGGLTEVVGGLDALPLDGGQGDNGYTLLELDLGPDEVRAVFRAAGPLGQSDEFNPDFELLDGAGEPLSLSGREKRWSRDEETGLWTVTLPCPGEGEAIAAQAAQVRFWQPELTLLEEKAVTISLTN